MVSHPAVSRSLGVYSYCTYVQAFKSKILWSLFIYYVCVHYDVIPPFPFQRTFQFQSSGDYSELRILEFYSLAFLCVSVIMIVMTKIGLTEHITGCYIQRSSLLHIMKDIYFVKYALNKDFRNQKKHTKETSAILRWINLRFEIPYWFISFKTIAAIQSTINHESLNYAQKTEFHYFYYV